MSDPPAPLSTMRWIAHSVGFLFLGLCFLFGLVYGGCVAF